MITYHKGDLLKSGCEIICHQVNLQGVMGGGIALQIARKYPDCEKEYRKYVNCKGDVSLGEVLVYFDLDGKFVANCFTQDRHFKTDYNALEVALATIKEFCENMRIKTVGFPHGYGCGIANGDWRIVEQKIKNAFENSDIDCQIWELI